MNNFYKTIEVTQTTEFKDRGSKFIGYVFPIINVNDFKRNIKDLKDANPKADHFCFAYRLGFDKNNFRVSDAGEPSGSAGKPILGQIDSKQLTNVMIVVVRYFGGTLLGVPGLINAYKTTASHLLQIVPIVQKEITCYAKLEFDYTQMNEVVKAIKQFRGKIIKNESMLFSIIELEIPLTEWHLFELNIKRLNNIVINKSI